jgi:hypothetical protein
VINLHLLTIVLRNIVRPHYTEEVSAHLVQSAVDFKMVCLLYNTMMTQHISQTVGPLTESSSYYMVSGHSLTLSLLMSYIYGAPSKARNLTSYIWTRFFTGDFAS